jgi:hypothetical protein
MDSALRKFRQSDVPFQPLGGDLVHGLHAKESFLKHMNMCSGVKILGRNPVQHVARTGSWRSTESPQLRYPRPRSTWRGPVCGFCNALRARKDTTHNGQHHDLMVADIKQYLDMGWRVASGCVLV